jgi:hypothetical protein
MADTPSYRRGRIVFAYLRSSKTGKRERHPAIILDRDKQIVQPENFDPRKAPGDNFVYVIGVSTKHKIYKSLYVQLPFAISGHTLTKLREDCGAIVGWYHRIAIPDDVIGFGGEVPAPIMLQIETAIRKDLAKNIGSEMKALKEVFDELFGDES